MLMMLNSFSLWGQHIKNKCKKAPLWEILSHYTAKAKMCWICTFFFKTILQDNAAVAYLDEYCFMTSQKGWQISTYQPLQRNSRQASQKKVSNNYPTKCMFMSYMSKSDKNHNFNGQSTMNKREILYTTTSTMIATKISSSTMESRELFVKGSFLSYVPTSLMIICPPHFTSIYLPMAVKTLEEYGIKWMKAKQYRKQQN